MTASDGTLTASQTFNWFVTAGVVTLTSPGDQTNTEGDNVSLQIQASDANNSTLTYQASGLPSGLSMNSSGLISGTIATGDAADGPYTVTVMAGDSQGPEKSAVLELDDPGTTDGERHRPERLS